MQKLRTTVTKITKKSVSLRVNGDEFSLPRHFVPKACEGDSLVVTLATVKEDSQSAGEVARELLRIALKGE